MISNLLSKNSSISDSSLSEDLLDVADLITGGREGILSFTINGNSAVEEIKQGCIVFVDAFQRPKPDDLILWKSGKKNCVRRFDAPQSGLYLLGSEKSPKTDSRVKGVIIAHLTFHKDDA